MNRRKQYRVIPEYDQDLEVSVRASGGRSFSGQPVDISFDGARVGFFGLSFDDVRLGPSFPLGEEVQLIFRFSGSKLPLVASATVVRRTDVQNRRDYGFRFTEHRQLETQLSPRLYKLFNRRAFLRVEPAPHSPVKVALQGGADGSEHQAELVDISEGGIGVRLPVESDAAFASTNRIGVTLSLPNYASPLNLEGIIRSRHLTGADTIQYGVEFDLGQNRHDQSKKNAIISYVMTCRRAGCRETKQEQRAKATAQRS